MRVAAAAEELGFWGVSVQDHILANSAVSPCQDSHQGEDRNVLEALQVLGFVAGRTERLRLIGGIFVVPFRSPIWFAKEIASIDVLSEGRSVVGVGVGALRGRRSDQGQNLAAHGDIARREFDLFGLPGHRGPLMDEYLQALKLLWTEDAPSFAGNHVSFDGLDLYPKPLQRPHPPIWVGGRSEVAQRRAVLHGDGWFPSQATPAIYEEGRSRILEMAASNSLPPPAAWGVNIFATIDPDEVRARNRTRRALGHRYQAEEAMFDSTLAGSPAQVRGQMERFVQAGVRTFDLKLLPLTVEDTLTQMQLLAAEIAPALGAEEPAR